MAVQKKLMTVAEFERCADAPENAERRLELIHGEIVEKAPTEEHSVVVGNIAAPLWHHNKRYKLGGRVGVEPRHRMSGGEHNARLPDIAFTSAARLLPLVKKGSVPQMPDLAVEVKSPDDSRKKLREKAEYYLSNGARLVWLVYPDSQTVEVCAWVEGALHIHTLDIDGTLDGGEVLPGFSLPIRDIFAE